MPRSVIACVFLGVIIQADTFSQQPKTTKIAGSQVDVDIYGNVFALDEVRNTLTLFSNDYVKLREIGGPGWENDQFDFPQGLWARNGIDVFVADYGNHRIQRFDRKLNFVSSLFTRDNTNPEERFGYPTDVALSRLGDLFIADGDNLRIVKVNRFSKVEIVFGGFDAGEGRLNAPSQLEVGPKDNVYVLDKSRIVVFDSFGNFLHELAEGLFKKPMVLFADNRSVVVLDKGILYCFDKDERPVITIPIESIPGVEFATKDIRSLVFAGTSMYVLTPDGLLIVPDPRLHKPRMETDK